MDKNYKIKEKILYIDAFNLFYRNFTTHPSVDYNGEPNGGYIGFIQQLKLFIEKFSPQYTVIVFDGAEAGLRRRQLYPDYKGRKARKKRFSYLKFDDDENSFVEPVDNEEEQILMIFETLRLLPVIVVQVDYYEADDIIAHLVTKAKGIDNIIVSNDKDYLQLINEDVCVYTPSAKVLYTEREVETKFGLLKDNYLFARLVEGDSSDKIKGVPGVALKSLIKFLPVLKTEPIETFLEFWELVETIEGKGKKIEALKNSKDLLFRNYQICNLKVLDISNRGLISVKRHIDEQKIKSFSSIRLKTFFVKNNVNHEIRNFDLWIKPFFALRTTPNFEI